MRPGPRPAAHRAFLSDFFSGQHPGSFARGAVFQHNPRTGDRRISGTTAALCGLEAAREAGDDEQVTVAVRRLLLLYSVVYAYGGIPLLYMGDELGLPNDADWAVDPVHAADNRWMHRPPMDWTAAERDATTARASRHRLFTGFQQLASTRASLLALRSGTVTQLVDTGNPHLLAYARRHPRGVTFLGLANFSDTPGEVGDDVLSSAVPRACRAPARLPTASAAPGRGSGCLRLAGPGSRTTSAVGLCGVGLGRGPLAPTLQIPSIAVLLASEIVTPAPGFA